MSERELELMERLIEMLGGAGEGAFWLAFMWIGKGYFTATLTALMFVVVAIALYRVFVPVFMVDWNAFRRAAGEAYPWGPVTPGERQRVLELIRKGREAEEKEQNQ